MTRKHFQVLADSLRLNKPAWPNPDTHKSAHAQWRDDCYAVARVCGQFNNNFNRARFFAACGLEESE